MTLKTRLEAIEKKIRPKPKPRPIKLRFIMPGSLEEKEFMKSMESLKENQGRVFEFNFEDPVMIMPRPGERPDTLAISTDFLPVARPKDTEAADPDVLTVRVVDPKAQDQAAKPDPQPEPEPSDDELEREIEKLEQRKAALLDKGKKT